MPCAEGEPAGVVAHDFRDDAVVAVRSAVESVDRLGGDAECGVEADGRIGEGDVVVDRLGERDDAQAFFDEAEGVFVGAAAADADEGIEFVFAIVGRDDVGHVALLALDRHAVGLVAAGAEDGAADGEDAGEGGFVEGDEAVFGEAEVAVAEADDVPSEIADGGFADGADGGVETGAVAAGGEDADAFDGFHRGVPRRV